MVQGYSGPLDNKIGDSVTGPSFRILKVWQILKHFAGAIHQAQTSFF